MYFLRENIRPKITIKITFECKQLLTRLEKLRRQCWQGFRTLRTLTLFTTMGVQIGTAALQNGWTLSWKVSTLHIPASFTYLSWDMHTNISGSLVSNSKNQTNKNHHQTYQIYKKERLNEWIAEQSKWNSYNTENILTVWVDLQKILLNEK